MITHFILLFLLLCSYAPLLFSDLDLKHTKDRLLGILSILLNRRIIPTPHTLHQSLKYFTFTLCRLSIWHGLLITPPVLKGEALISYKVLDEALMESEVCVHMCAIITPLMMVHNSGSSRVYATYKFTGLADKISI